MKLKTRLSLAFAMVVLLTVALISLLANLFIVNEFKNYMTNRLEQKTQEIVADLSAQYNKESMAWDIGFVHTIGMYALQDGYIMRVSDAQNQVLWDAEVCDMSACMQVMEDIASRMHAESLVAGGAFTSRDFILSQEGAQIGLVTISYYGPFFLSENDSIFLDAMNTIFAVIGIASLLLSVVVGVIMSKRISDPIVKTVDAAKRMSGGDYSMRIYERSNTKELGELIAAVNQLSEALGSQKYLRKQLTADIAHELRTPLTSVQTHLEAMLEGIWETTPEHLTSCHEEVMRIGVLINDLESLARTDSGNITLDKRPVDLAHLMRKAISGFAVDIEKKELTVSIHGAAPEVPADEDRMYQVAVNLLSNAIKYGERGGYIHIRLSRAEECAVLEVQDDGIGIAKEDLPFIFERFYRADKSRNRKSGGSGIGLAVVKSIVEAHGGKVEAQSNPGGGSCFTVTLPLNT